MYRTQIVVSGHGPFPVDMLRYDQAAPANDRAVGCIVGANYLDRDVRECTLNIYHARKNEPGVTPARWTSMGWSCKIMQTEKIT